MTQEYNNNDIDTLSSISSQTNDKSFSYKNMSIIESLLDNGESNLNDSFQKINNNNSQEKYMNSANNAYFINPNNLNINNNLFLNQLSLNYNNQNLLLNNLIQNYQLYQVIMNILKNQNKNNFKNVNRQYTNIPNKSKKNNNIQNNNLNIKKNKTKPENVINISSLISGEEKRTIVRLSPIPNKYSPFDIILLLDKYLKTKKGERIYSSLYVPLAKEIGKNKGYCFINLVSPKYVIEFYRVFNGLNFKIKNCKKPCTVVFSDKQNVDCSNDDALKRPIVFNDLIKV